MEIQSNIDTLHLIDIRDQRGPLLSSTVSRVIDLKLDLRHSVCTQLKRFSNILHECLFQMNSRMARFTKCSSPSSLAGRYLTDLQQSQFRCSGTCNVVVFV